MVKSFLKWMKLIQHPYHWWDHLLFFKTLRSCHQISQGSWNYYLDLIVLLEYGDLSRIEYDPIEKVFIPIWSEKKTNHI